VAKRIRHLFCGLLDFSVIHFRYLDVEISTEFLMIESGGASFAGSQARNIELNMKQNTTCAQLLGTNHRECVRLATRTAENGCPNGIPKHRI
jgi:hypothetical protein